ncbi:uncharacterized protein LOC143033060 [Oratosquilla oratoria]|uniref:uncharacterized protein LOC143033060 n=1 Tax=Oratosquilla oratoria TaxID=337810 RepID=UPI003F773874
MVQQFHDGMHARVQNDGEYSQPFPVGSEVKQGCVLAPTLFSMIFTAMLTDAFRDGDIGVSFRYLTDGKLFNHQRLQAKTKVHEAIARDFLLADDCALNASTQADMQRSVDLFTRACDDFGLTISTNKTEVLHQPSPSAVYTELHITTKGQRLTVADKFTYLGSTLSRSINIDEEMTYSLSAFHIRCLRTLLRVKWQDRVSDTEVLQRAKMESIHAILMRSQLRWAGHVHRIENGRLRKR